MDINFIINRILLEFNQEIKAKNIKDKKNFDKNSDT